MEAAGLKGGMPWPAGKALPLLSSKVGGQGRGLPDPLAALRIEGRARGGAPQLWHPFGMGDSAGKRGGMGVQPWIGGSGPQACRPPPVYGSRKT